MCKPNTVWAGHVQPIYNSPTGSRNRRRSIGEKIRRMGYVLRVKLASFFSGAASASGLGLYLLYKDYKTAQQAVSDQLNSLYRSLDGRISSLEKLEGDAAPKEAEAT